MPAPNSDPLRIVSAEFKAAAAALDQLPPPSGVEIAFVGRSNVGKSSLVNALCGSRKLVRTSSTPGCTRQLTFFEARTLDGAVLTLVDLPGYGYARRSKQERGHWAGLVEGYLLGRPTLRVVVSIVDVRRGAEEEERQLLELLHSPSPVARPNVVLLLVATKLDKLPLNQRKPALSRLQGLSGIEMLPFSTELADTQLALWRRLRKLAATC